MLFANAMQFWFAAGCVIETSIVARLLLLSMVRFKRDCNFSLILPTISASLRPEFRSGTMTMVVDVADFDEDNDIIS